MLASLWRHSYLHPALAVFSLPGAQNTFTAPSLGIPRLSHLRTNSAAVRQTEKQASAEFAWWERGTFKGCLSTDPTSALKYSKRPLNASWLECILRAGGQSCRSGEIFSYVLSHEYFPFESDCGLPLLIQYQTKGELTATCL